MKFQSPRGTRDFYPQETSIRNWIVEQWRRVSLRNGFQEYDGPIFENLDLYRIKSGDEIVNDLFHFTDRGGREFAIRPEMTPTLARMVAARAASLPRPVKWFSVPRLCRAERPQRGRLREFFQWNIDILGEEGIIADAESIFVAADFFRQVGLSAEHFVIKISSRELLAALLERIRISPDRFDAVYAVLDKRDKVEASAFEDMVAQLGLTSTQCDTLTALGAARGPEGLEHAGRLLAGHPNGQALLAKVERLFDLLEKMGVGALCRFDMGIVRGLGYYTGMVFEAFGTGQLQRAICGGGRYDQLLMAVGGPPMSGTGFATSDVVIQDVLEELGLVPTFPSAVDIFVIDAQGACFDEVLRITMTLRASNVATAFSYKRQSLNKQFKQADRLGVRRVVVVDTDAESEGVVHVKDMQTGVQRRVTVESLFQDPLAPIGP